MSIESVSVEPASIEKLLQEIDKQIAEIENDDRYKD